jgi:uncharacterized Zn finger protein
VRRLDTHEMTAAMSDHELNLPCPDCGCPVIDHNAVNRVMDGSRIAHCGGCGACWKTRDHPDYVKVVLRFLQEDKQ